MPSIEDFGEESEAESVAIDIFNQWNMGWISRQEAIELSQFDLLYIDDRAWFWIERIWKNEGLDKKGGASGTN
jgi:hypothetical protein